MPVQRIHYSLRRYPRTFEVVIVSNKPTIRSFRLTANSIFNPSIQIAKRRPVVDDPKSPYAAVSRVNPERSRQLALAAARTAAENGGLNITVLDMNRQTALFDYFVIVTGTSRRQLHAMSEEIDHKLEDELNDRRMNIDGYDESRWIVLDYGTVVIHLFDEDTRAFYSLEALWADAEKVDLSELLADI